MAGTSAWVFTFHTNRHKKTAECRDVGNGRHIILSNLFCLLTLYDNCCTNGTCVCFGECESFCTQCHSLSWKRCQSKSIMWNAVIGSFIKAEEENPFRNIHSQNNEHSHVCQWNSRQLSLYDQSFTSSKVTVHTNLHFLKCPLEAYCRTAEIDKHSLVQQMAWTQILNIPKDSIFGTGFHCIILHQF